MSEPRAWLEAAPLGEIEMSWWLQKASELYPGWRVRIYHNVTGGQSDQATYLCRLHCTHHLLDLCDVRDVPELSRHGELEARVDLGRWWRFIVLGDPTVRRFGIRDLDMFILHRERDAVTAWEEEGSKQVDTIRWRIEIFVFPLTRLISVLHHEGHASVQEQGGHPHAHQGTLSSVQGTE